MHPPTKCPVWRRPRHRHRSPSPNLSPNLNPNLNPNRNPKLIQIQLRAQALIPILRRILIRTQYPIRIPTRNPTQTRLPISTFAVLPKVAQDGLHQLQEATRLFRRSQAKANNVAVPQISGEAMEVIAAFGWPGNVRQLKNTAERLVVRMNPGRAVTPADLPPEILGSFPLSRRPAGAQEPRRRSDVMFEQLVKQRESFWTVVYEPLMNRDITRDDVRTLVAHGAELTGGGVAPLVVLFNIEPKDARRFASFLRKYQCHPELPRESAAVQLTDSVDRRPE